MKFLVFCWLTFSVSPTLWASYSPTLTWDASPDAGVSGYKVYWGLQPKTYTSSVDAGNNLTVKIQNLDEGVFYYFAATAYTAEGLESDFSEEIKFYSPIRLWLSREGVLTTYIPVLQSYVLEKTYDLVTWQGIQTFSPEKNEVKIPIDMKEPYAFYRLMKLPAEQQVAIRAALRSMTTQITPPKKVKLTLWQKFKNALRYHPERHLHPRDSKGAPYVWAGEVYSKPSTINPPMPVRK